MHGQLERRDPRRGDHVEDGRRERIGEQREREQVRWTPVPEADPAVEAGHTSPFSERPTERLRDPDVEALQERRRRGERLRRPAGEHVVALLGWRELWWRRVDAGRALGGREVPEGGQRAHTFAL